jgi:hypothetical protein
MGRRSRRSSTREKGKTAGWIYGGLGTAIIVGIVALAVYLNVTRRDTDRKTGCPTDHYDSITAVLVDLTDPISPTQAAALRNALLKIRDDVPKFGLLEIYPLASTATNTIAPLFSGCSPGSGRDVDNRLYGNPELADRIWRIQFANKIDQVAGEMLKLPRAENSPIFEAIQSVTVTAFGTPMAEKSDFKRLVIISDMIHYTSQLSMYQGAPTFDRFKQTPYYTKVKPLLRDAKVDVYLIVRDTRRSVQQPPLYKFWVEYFAGGDGYLRNWEPMQ